MQFTLVAEDDKDTEALNRRMAARDQHLEVAKKLKAEGHVLYGAALLGDEGKIIGSVYVYENRTVCCRECMEDDDDPRVQSESSVCFLNIYKQVR